MRTKGGWVFLCKDCWNRHLIPYSKLSEDSKEKIEVYIKCPKPIFHMSIMPYKRTEFERWVGDEWVYTNNVVEPAFIKRYE